MGKLNTFMPLDSYPIYNKIRILPYESNILMGNEIEIVEITKIYIYLEIFEEPPVKNILRLDLGTYFNIFG